MGSFDAGDLPNQFPVLSFAPGKLERALLPPSNLPPLPNPFIGREAVVNEICTLVLWENVRLLTLTGPGGVGKTRVALQVARRLLPEFENGVWFVPLASVSSPDLVVPAIAGALGIKEENSTPLLHTLGQHFAERSLLLILDNFEQVVQAAPQVANLIMSAPGVQVLVTSRMPLRLYGEHEYPIPPMQVPRSESTSMETMPRIPQPGTMSQDLATIAAFDGVQLFVARVREIDPHFVLTQANSNVVAGICRRLDGLPLALELAAGRLRLFQPSALLKRLEHSLQLLTGGAHDLSARQRTLHGSIAWSYDLLAPSEQELFALLSVFSGGCSLSAIEQVASALSLDAEGNKILLDILESLVSQNLLRNWQRNDSKTEPVPDDEPRFWMLATIREFAQEKLAQSGNLGSIQEAHARFFLALAEEASAHLRGPDEVVWLERLERDHDNFRAALTYLLEQSNRILAIRLVSAMSWFWYVHGHITEGRTWFNLILVPAKEDAVPMTPASEEERSWWADALRGAGSFAFMQSDYEQAVIFTTQSLEMARPLGNRGLMARALNNLSTILSQQGELKKARPFLEESLEIKRHIGDRVELAPALSNLALNRERLGDYEQANRLNEEAADIAREGGNKSDLASRIHTRGTIAMREGNLAPALASFNESLALAKEVGFKSLELWALSDIGIVLCDVEDDIAAEAVLEQALQLSKEIGDPSEESWLKLGLGRVALLRSEYERAQKLMQDALRLRIQLREYNPSVIEILEWLATVEAELARRGNKVNATRAAILLGASDARREAMGTPVPLIWRDRHKQTTDLVRNLLDRRAFSVAWAKGRSIPFAEAVELAIQDSSTEESATSPTAAAPTQPDSWPPLIDYPPSAETGRNLTSREVDIMRLLAAGLTNKEIGERLVLSHRTVQAHLYNIFSKLDVTTRTAATRYAIEHGLA